MPPGLALTSLLVRDYDEAIDFFVRQLGWTLAEDSPSTTSVGNRPKRWVVVQPPDSISGALLLAKADGHEQEALVGKQFAGRVGLFWHVKNFDTTYLRMQGAGIEFQEEPRTETYGKIVVFKDLYGNKWDMMEPSDSR